MKVYPNIRVASPFTTTHLWYAMISVSICLDILAGGKKRDQKESDHSDASPWVWWGRLFALTKDVRSHGWGKSCWSELTSASMSCRAAHLWLVEEASFSSSVAWSSCWWREVGSSAGIGSCNTKERRWQKSDRVRGKKEKYRWTKLMEPSAKVQIWSIRQAPGMDPTVGISLVTSSLWKYYWEKGKWSVIKIHSHSTVQKHNVSKMDC